MRYGVANIRLKKPLGFVASSGRDIRPAKTTSFLKTSGTDFNYAGVRLHCSTHEWSATARGQPRTGLLAILS